MLRSISLKCSQIGIALFFCLYGTAYGDVTTNTQSVVNALPEALPTSPSKSTITDNDNLTWNGITLYGKVDVGYLWRHHVVKCAEWFGVRVFKQ